MSLFDTIRKLEIKVKAMEERFYEMGSDMRASVQSEVKKRWTIAPQAETYFGMYLALCVDTLDRSKQGKVRMFSPLFNEPNVPYTALDWAYPVSAMGGFDDSGLTWVPPSGSLLCVLFSRGSRSSPFYIGTTWSRSRGSGGKYLKGYPDLQEYWKIHAGHRKGYLVGPDDESQIFPPWNTDNYQGFDIDSSSDKEDTINAQIKNMTYPHIYGFKSPQKHMLKWDDGDYKCNHRYKRMEWQSSCGNYFIFKDDHLHAACQWAHPACGCEGGGGEVESPCHDEWGQPKEKPPGWPEACGKSWLTPQCSNKYFKHKNECRPCKSQTPQGNTIAGQTYGLPQSGIAFLSISGHYFGMCDRVGQPRGKPEWERSLLPFDYGCTDKYEGKTWWTSSTGHRIEMNDWEEPKNVRGWAGPFQGNYIRVMSACGNILELNDHTLPECTAGQKRGVLLRSTSGNFIRMGDEGATQCTPPRMEMGSGRNPTPPDGRPMSNAKRAFIQIRTGYGLEMIFRDDNSQKDTQSQYIRILAPQKDNKDRGPHIEHFQEAPSGPGFVFLRVGGNYLIYTYDNFYTIVGSPLPKDKVTMVSQHTLHATKKFYINTADIHLFMADRYIFLLAGKDCTGPPQGPCAGPILVLSPKGIVYSDRVFASYSPGAMCAPIFHMWPFVSCGGN